MWVLNFLPNWLFHLIVLAGILGIVASLVLSFIPFVSQYKQPIQVASIIALVVGIFFEGAISNNDAWLLRVAEMEQKVAEAEAKANKANVQIVTKVLTQQQLIKEKGAEVVKYIDREVVKYDNQCIIPTEFITAVNEAAKGGKK